MLSASNRQVWYSHKSIRSSALCIVKLEVLHRSSRIHRLLASLPVRRLALPARHLHSGGGCRCAAAAVAAEAPRQQQSGQKKKGSNKAEAQKITAKSEDYNRWLFHLAPVPLRTYLMKNISAECFPASLPSTHTLQGRYCWLANTSIFSRNSPYDQRDAS